MTSYSYTATARIARSARSPAGSDRPSVAAPLLVAGLSLLALALVWVIAELVPAAHVRDAALLGHFLRLDDGRLFELAKRGPLVLNPVLDTIWAVALVLVAIARGRPRVAVAVAAVMALAPFSADILKPLLAHQHASAGWTTIGPASYPSGHSTAAAILAMCAVYVAPDRLRPTVAALGTVFVVGISALLLIGAWHMPSDVLGGYLMAALWMALAVAGVRASQRRWPTRSRRARQVATEAPQPPQ